MDNSSKKIKVDDLANDATEELSEDEIRKVSGGAADAFSIGASGPAYVSVRGWDPKNVKAIIGKADD